MPDINFAKFNIPVNIVKAFDQGRIDKLYQGIYAIADAASTADATRFQAKKAAAYFSAMQALPPNKIPDKNTENPAQIMQEVADYKSERLDFHIREMVHLFELYARSKQQK